MGIFDRITKVKKQEDIVRVSGKAKEKTPVEKKSAPSSVAREKKNVRSSAYRVLAHPLLSEKATIHEGVGVYTFVVQKHSTKTEIARAVYATYGIKPVQVRVANIEGKRMRFGGFPGRKGDWKKAMVTMPKGATIAVHEGV